MSGNTLNIGQFANFAAAVMKALPRDISAKDALAWEKNGARLAQALASALCPLATTISPQTLPLVSQSCSDLVLAGKYTWSNDRINDKNFPPDPSLDGEWEWDLFDPKDSISSENAEKACSKDGWIPATIFYLLAFGVKYPDVQKKNPVVGLGSSCHGDFGDRHVPVLDVGGDGRGLDLNDWDGVWGSYYRFLRVRRLAA